MWPRGWWRSWRRSWRGSARTAARVPENHLPKLRGFRNSEVRMAIAGFLGVRPAAELGRLRAARDVVAALLAAYPEAERNPTPDQGQCVLTL